MRNETEEIYRTFIEGMEDAIVTDKDGTAYSADLSTRDGALEVLTQSLETTKRLLEREVEFYTDQITILKGAITWVQAYGVPQVEGTA